MSFLHRLAARPLLPFCSALIAVLGLLAALLYWHYSQRNQEIHLAHFGQALASHAARQAVNPTLSQDLISLQVILQELTRHPAIAGATIHDVEQQLLVQSGFSADDALSHSAPITLHNNVAGYVRIAMAPPVVSGPDWRFFGLWSLIIVFAMVAPWAPGTICQWRQAAKEPEAADPALPETPLGEPITVRLALEICNLPLLHQQLNLDSFSQLVVRLEEQLQGVLTLYGGKRQGLAHHWLLMDFDGYEPSDCAVRALCSAWLLSELASTNAGPKLRLSAQVFPLVETKSTNLLQELVTQLGDGSPLPEGIFLATDLLDESVQEHLQLDPDSGRLLDIRASYKTLLEKQQQQLQQFARFENA